MKLFLVTLISMFFATVSYARSIYAPTFEIRTYNNNAYICNAGLRHPAPSAAQFCHVMGTQQTCHAGSANCVCKGTNVGGYLMDYMSYRTSDYSQRLSSPARALKSGLETFSTAVKPESSFQTVLEQSDFNLGSELFGAQYFVDVCFRGPQIDYTNEDESKAVKTTYVVYSQLRYSGLNPTTGENTTNSQYIALAKPTLRTTIHCDLQGKGALKKATLDESTATDIDWSALAAGQNGLSDFAVSKETAYGDADVSINHSINAYIGAKNSSEVPRFCVARYEVRESDISGERKWTRYDNKFKIHLRIEEIEAN